MVEVPACPRWHFDKSVTIQPDTTAWDIAMRYLGSGGERALGQLQQANQDIDIAELEPGQQIRVPYVSLPVSYRLRQEYEEHAQEVADDFRSRRSNGVGGLRVLDVDVSEPLRAIEPLLPEVDPRDEFPDPGREPEPTLHFESAIEHQERGVGLEREETAEHPPILTAEESADEMAAEVIVTPIPDHEPEGDSRRTGQTSRQLPPEPQPAPTAPAGLCPEALERPDWPFDAESLAATLRENRQRTRLEIDPAVVAVVDTGIERAETGVYDLAATHELRPLDQPRFWFSFSRRELNGRRFWDDDGNIWKDDIIGTNLVTMQDFPEAEADPEYPLGDHGIHVAGLILGGFKSAPLHELASERIRLKILNAVEKRVRVRPGGHDTEWRIDRAALSNGLLYAGATARIANYSLTAGATLQDTFKNNFNSTPTLLLVTAAGNAGSDLNRDPLYPMALGGAYFATSYYCRSTRPKWSSARAFQYRQPVCRPCSAWVRDRVEYLSR